VNSSFFSRFKTNLLVFNLIVFIVEQLLRLNTVTGMGNSYLICDSRGFNCCLQK